MAAISMADVRGKGLCSLHQTIDAMAPSVRSFFEFNLPYIVIARAHARD